MADDANTTAAAAEGDKPDTDGGNSAGAATQADQPTEDRKFTQAEVNTFVKREAAKELKKELARIQAEQAEKEKPEVERLKGETERLARELRERDARDEVIEAASDKKVGARNPRALYRIVRDDLEYDDKGKITNLSDVLKQAKADFPELFHTTGSANGGAGGQSAAPVNMNDMIRRAAGRAQ